MIEVCHTLPPLSLFRAPHLVVPGVFHKIAGVHAESWLSMCDRSCGSVQWLAFCLLLRERDASGRGLVRIQGSELFCEDPDGALARLMISCACRVAAETGAAAVRFFTGMSVEGMYPLDDTWFGSGTADRELALSAAACNMQSRPAGAILSVTGPAVGEAGVALREQTLDPAPAPGAPAGERLLLGLSHCWTWEAADRVLAVAYACPDVGPEVMSSRRMPTGTPFAGRRSVIWKLQLAPNLSLTDRTAFLRTVADRLIHMESTAVYIPCREGWLSPEVIGHLCQRGASVVSQVVEYRLTIDGGEPARSNALVGRRKAP